mmetsp:Transcript_16477/g.33585  ORF Transcript_16477/g.33585 Transcript_16477/m.33585 type:complete len:269 (+) Transcript_16477:474-1280(+)
MDRAALQAPRCQPRGHGVPGPGRQRSAARQVHLRGAEQAVPRVQQGVHEQNLGGCGPGAVSEARHGAGGGTHQVQQADTVHHSKRRAGAKRRGPLLRVAVQRAEVRVLREVHASVVRPAHEEASVDRQPFQHRQPPPHVRPGHGSPGPPRPRVGFSVVQGVGAVGSGAGVEGDGGECSPPARRAFEGRGQGGRRISRLLLPQRGGHIGRPSSRSDEQVLRNRRRRRRRQGRGGGRGAGQGAGLRGGRRGAHAHAPVLPVRRRRRGRGV